MIFQAMPFKDFEMQFDNYIDDLRKDDSFKDLNNLVDLLVKLVETHMDKVYDLVHLLLLPVATVSVERAFSAMYSVIVFWMLSYAPTLSEKFFFKVNEDDILETFMAIRKRRPTRNSIVTLFELF